MSLYICQFAKLDFLGKFIKKNMYFFKFDFFEFKVGPSYSCVYSAGEGGEGKIGLKRFEINSSNIFGFKVGFKDFKFKLKINILIYIRYILY